MKTYLFVALTAAITSISTLTTISLANAATEANPLQPLKPVSNSKGLGSPGGFFGQTIKVAQGKSSSSQTTIWQEGPNLTVPTGEPEAQSEDSVDQPPPFVFELPGNDVEIPAAITTNQSPPIVETPSNESEDSNPVTTNQSPP
ncbi:MAG: hypothetical protein WA919_26300, partial [Coleofasciculaceae cyanobacterium]